MPDPAQNNRARVRGGLDAATEALQFAVEQTEAKAWRWVSIAMCIALQGALVAALSGYETAQREDILQPDSNREDDTNRIASIQTLLRRAASADYLADPQRLSGKNGAKKATLALVAIRNEAVHVSPVGRPLSVEGVRTLLPGPLELIRHCVVEHPAWDQDEYQRQTQKISAALARLNALIC